MCKDTWAGLMNFKYYGELFDPELSNLSIGTLGVGARLNSALSLDLVWHGYDQVQAATSQRNTNLKANPDGIHEDLGQEFDVILGSKAIKDWDLELIYGRLVPGSAFPGGDAANLVSILLRTRF